MRAMTNVVSVFTIILTANLLLAGSRATAAPPQHLPVLPAGARVVVQAPMIETRPGLLRFPIRTGPPFPRRQLDQAKIARTTGQLESLLNAVQPELKEASKGELPADLIPNLKRIEKLTKQLRRQMSP